MPQHEEVSASSVAVLTEYFKALGNSTRIRILLLLMEKEACVGELALALGYTQSAISHQLSLLKANGLVCKRRAGQKIVYALADQRVRTVLEESIEQIRS